MVKIFVTLTRTRSLLSQVGSDSQQTTALLIKNILLETATFRTKKHAGYIFGYCCTYGARGIYAEICKWQEEFVRCERESCTIEYSTRCIEGPRNLCRVRHPQNTKALRRVVCFPIPLPRKSKSAENSPVQRKIEDSQMSGRHVACRSLGFYSRRDSRFGFHCGLSKGKKPARRYLRIGTRKLNSEPCEHGPRGSPLAYGETLEKFQPALCYSRSAIKFTRFFASKYEFQYKYTPNAIELSCISFCRKVI